MCECRGRLAAFRRRSKHASGCLTVLQPSRVGGACVVLLISFFLSFLFGQALILSFEQLCV